MGKPTRFSVFIYYINRKEKHLLVGILSGLKGKFPFGLENFCVALTPRKLFLQQWLGVLHLTPS